MARTVEELITLIAEGDESAQTELTNLLANSNREAAIAKRDLRLKTDEKLRERYPRALRAWEKGHLSFADSVSEDEMAEMLRSKEDEYASLGVPIDTQPASAPAPVVETVQTEDGSGDPAQALAGGKAASSPGGQPRDLVAEYFDALKGSTIHDQARANAVLVELNKSGQQDKIGQITHQLEARPISLTTI